MDGSYGYNAEKFSSLPLLKSKKCHTWYANERESIKKAYPSEETNCQ